MAKNFNLVGTVKIAGPVGLDSVVRQIRSKLSDVSVKVDLKLGRNAQDIARLTSNFDKFNASLRETTITANSAARSLQNLSAAVNNTNFNRVATQVGSLGNTIRVAGSNFRTVSKDIDKAGFSAIKFGHDSALALKRFAAFTIPTTAFFGITAGFAAGIKSAAEFERQLVRIGQTLKVPVSSLSNLSNTITELSTTLGVSSAELVDISLILNQAGLSAKDTAIALDVLAKTSLSPSFEDIIDTTDGMIAAMNQFDIQAEDLITKFNSINEVSAKYPVESGDIISAIRKTGGAFRAAGGDLEQLIALFSAIRSTTRESADTIATGIRTIAGRLQRQDTVEALSALNVELRDAEGNFVGVFEAFQRLGRALEGISPQSQVFADIVEQIGGLRQLSKVIPGITQYAKAQEILNVALTKSNGLQLNAQQAQESLIQQVLRLKEEFLSLFREIADSDTFKVTANIALDAADAFVDLARALKPVLPLFAALATIQVGKSLGAIGQFAKGFGQFFTNKNQDIDPLQGILARREKAQQQLAAKQLKAEKEVQRANKSAQAEQDRTNRKEQAKLREEQRLRDKAARLERQSRIDSERSALTQAKIQTERARAAGVGRTTGGGNVSGVNAVIDKNTGALNRLTGSIERLIIALSNNPPGGGGGDRRGGGGRGPTRPAPSGPSAGSSGISNKDKAEFRNLINDPGVAAVLSNIARTTQSKTFEERRQSSIFVTPTGVAGGISDLERIRERELANRRIQELERSRARRRDPRTGRFLSGPTNALVPISGGPVVPFQGVGPTNLATRPTGGPVRAFNPISGQIVEIPPTGRRTPTRFGPQIIGARSFSNDDLDRLRRQSINDALGGDFFERRPPRPPAGPISPPIVNSLARSIEKANEKAAQRQRFNRGAGIVGISAAIAAPTILEQLRNPEALRQAGRSDSVGVANQIARQEAGISALSTGLLTGAGVGFAVGGAPGAIAGAFTGVATAAFTFSSELEKITKEINRDRLANAINDVTDAFERLKKGAITPEDFNRLVNRVVSNAVQNVRFGVGQGRIEPEALSGFLGGSADIISAIGSFFGATELGGGRASRARADSIERQRFLRSTAIQQEFATAADVQDQTIANVVQRLVARGGGNLLDQAEIRNILQDRNQQLVAASRTESGARDIAEGFDERAAKLGEALTKRNLEQLQKTVNIRGKEQISLINEQQILDKTSAAMNVFSIQLKRLGEEMDSLKVGVENASAAFDATANLAVGAGGRAFNIPTPDLSNFGRFGSQSSNLIRQLISPEVAQRAQDVGRIQDSVAGLIEDLITQIPIESITAGTTLTQALGEPQLRALTDTGISPSDIRRSIALATGGRAIQGEELKEFINELRRNRGSVTERIAGGFNEEQDAIKRVVELSVKNLEIFADKLSRINQVVEQTRQLQSQANQRRLQAVGARADLQSAITGRNREEFISDQDFLRPLTERIEPLLRQAGLGQFNAGNITANRLRGQISADTNVLRLARQDLTTSPTRENVTRVNELENSIRAAQKALEELGNATEPLANIERKLTAVLADRQARESSARNFAGSGIRERFESEINRRFLDSAVRRGNFVNVGEQQRALQAANQLGDAFQLPGGESVGEAINRLLRNTPRGILRNVDIGVNNEEKQLRQQQIEILNKQTEFLSSLATINQKVGETLRGELTAFAGSADKLTDALNKFTPNLTLSGNAVVDVRVTGADVFRTLEPRFKELGEKIANDAINKLIKERFPESGPR